MMKNLLRSFWLFKFREEKKQLWYKKLKNDYNLKPNSGLSLDKKMKWVLMGFFLIFGIAIYFGLQMKSDERKQVDLAQTYVDQLNILQDPNLVRKDFSEKDQLRVKAMEYYTDKQYEKCVETYDKLKEKTDLEAYDSFYLGVCHLKLNSISDAIFYLNKSLMLGGPSQEIEWSLCLAYILDNENENARGLLNKIVSNEQYMYRKARKILNILDK